MKLFIVLVFVVALVLCTRFARWLAAPRPAPRPGCLDDDGVKRGPCWDGSWLSGPRAVSAPA